MNILADTVKDFILEEISDELEFIKARKVILIPIPLSKTKRLLRGYNQMEEFCKVLLPKLPDIFELNTTVLKRHHRPAQSSIKKRKERLQNLKNTFWVKGEEKMKGRTVILLDDVVTTGATMKEAADALKASGVRCVHTLALAH